MAKILLAEDDNSLREIYGTRLLAEGYDIVSAPDGESALQMAVKELPDLILSDVMMPRISGFEMIDILRSQEETRGIKVIVMTALSTDTQREQGESLGVDKYLVKSQVGIEDVVATIHEVLGDSGNSFIADGSGHSETEQVDSQETGIPEVEEAGHETVPEKQVVTPSLTDIAAIESILSMPSTSATVEPEAEVVLPAEGPETEPGPGVDVESDPEAEVEADVSPVVNSEAVETAEDPNATIENEEATKPATPVLIVPEPEPEEEKEIPSLNFDNEILAAATTESVPAEDFTASVPVEPETDSESESVEGGLDDASTSDEVPPPEAY